MTETQSDVPAGTQAVLQAMSHSRQAILAAKVLAAPDIIIPKGRRTKQRLQNIAQGMSDEQIIALRAATQEGWANFVIFRENEGEYCPIADLPDGSPLREFVRYSVTTAKSPQPNLALGAAITMFGAVAGRIYQSPSGLRTNFYAIGIAESGSGKDRPMRAATDVLAETFPHLVGPSNIKSGRALVTLAEDKPSVFMPIDEGGDLIAAAGAQNAPAHLKEIMSNLTRLYSAATGIYTGDGYANTKENPQVQINNPCVSIFMLSNPGSFWDALASENITNGSLARLIAFETSENFPDPNKVDCGTDVPETLIEAVKSVRAGPIAWTAPELGVDLPNVRVRAHVVQFACPEAEKYSDQLEHEELLEKRKHETTNLSSIVARTYENAMKMALIRAITENPARPFITARHLKWGWYLSKRSVDRLKLAARSDIADTPEAKSVNKLEQFIKDGGAIGRTGAEITRQFRGIYRRASERSEVLGTLCEAGLVGKFEDDSGKTKVDRWVHLVHVSPS